MEPEKPRAQGWARFLWLMLYAVICGCEFVLEAVKDFVSERVKGKTEDEDDDD